MTINQALLNTLENELILNQEPLYQKIIPIKNYSYDTKKTLDYLIEKYGGFINRYDDKVIIFINYSSGMKQTTETPIKQENRYASLRFEKINASINGIEDRLTLIEEKVNRLVETQNDQYIYQNKNLKTYMEYFETKDNKKEIKRLIDEIINHK